MSPKDTGIARRSLPVLRKKDRTFMEEMNLQTERQKRIEMVHESLDELRQFQRMIASYLRDYTVNGQSDNAMLAALSNVNQALDVGMDLLAELEPIEEDNYGDLKV